MAAMAVNRTEIEALLPFYVNGTLRGDERTSVEAALDEDARLRDEAETLGHIRQSMRDIDMGHTPGEFGLARLMRDIDRAAPARQPVVRRQSTRLSWGLAAAAAVALVAVGLGRFGFQDTAPYTQASGGADETFLTLAFQPEASQAQVSDLLLEYGLVIVDGPSAIGLYRVDPGQGRDVAALAAELRDREEVIESVDTP
jgi:anti-sigma-K factor RskA